MNKPKTLLDRLWDAHVVVPETDECPAILYIDLHLVHEVTSPQAFSVLQDRGLSMRRPELTLATIDHSVPTLPRKRDGTLPYASPAAEKQVAQLQANCANHGIELLDLDDERRGIVHVVGPELGLTQPGKTIVCGDSHTSTHGAFGALAFGIGTTEVGHVLATQCVLQRKPKAMRVTFEEQLIRGVGAKDMALAMISQIGADGGQGCAIEFGGSAVRALSMEGRMTLCNMAIEAGARVGLVAPDQTTYDWLEGRDRSPKGEAWVAAVAAWSALRSDDDAHFEIDVTVNAAAILPMITYGTSPDAAAAASTAMPRPVTASDHKAADYMGFVPGQGFDEVKIDRVFIGSCTNSRLSDLREAAAILQNRRIAAGVTTLVVPGSECVRRDAEAEGLHEIFLAAGAQWREPGCSMCIAMNGDQGEPGELVVSTSNRNFVGRQGANVRTVLAGPATAAACAIAGYIADPRAYLPEPPDVG